MALVSCKECGHKVSDTADKCPSCGVKLKPKTSGLTKFALITIGITLVAGFFLHEPEPTVTARACEPLVHGLIQLPDSRSEAQADFTAKAGRLMASGVCITDGGWSESKRDFYFTAFNPSAPKQYFFIRLNREQLKP